MNTQPITHNPNTPERITHLAIRNNLSVSECYQHLYALERQGDCEVVWGFSDDGLSDTVRIEKGKVLEG